MRKDSLYICVFIKVKMLEIRSDWPMCKLWGMKRLLGICKWWNVLRPYGRCTSISEFIITTLSHKLYKHPKVLYICGITLLLWYTSKRDQINCGWPLEYKSLSIYIYCFLLILFYLFPLFHNMLSARASTQFWKGSCPPIVLQTSNIICVVLSTHCNFFFFFFLKNW